MHRIMVIAVWANALLMATFLLTEIFGIGPIAKIRLDQCYELLVNTGHPVFWTVIWGFFFFIVPLINLLAIIVKPRITVNNFGNGSI